jgi:hypothetical protein
MLIDCPNGCHEGSFECKVLTVSCPTTQMYGSGGAAGAFTCRKCGGSGYRNHPACGGTGRIWCGRCHGRGKIDTDDFSERVRDFFRL